MTAWSLKGLLRRTFLAISPAGIIFETELTGVSGKNHHQLSALVADDLDVRDWYQVLGIACDATPAEIREAWRLKSKLLHPDRHIDQSDDVQQAAHAESALVNQAYEVLCDERRRAEFDAQLSRRTALHDQTEEASSVEEPDNWRTAWNQPTSPSPLRNSGRWLTAHRACLIGTTVVIFVVTFVSGWKVMGTTPATTNASMTSFVEVTSTAADPTSTSLADKGAVLSHSAVSTSTTEPTMCASVVPTFSNVSLTTQDMDSELARKVFSGDVENNSRLGVHLLALTVEITGLDASGIRRTQALNTNVATSTVIEPGAEVEWSSYTMTLVERSQKVSVSHARWEMIDPVTADVMKTSCATSF